MSVYNPSKRIFIPSLFVLIVLLAFFGPAASAQVKSQKSPSYPKILNSPSESQKQQLAATPILKLINQASQEMPLAFAWQLNADTLVRAKDLIRELIEFNSRATIRKANAIDTLTLQKNPKAEYDVRKNFLSFSISMATYVFSQQKGKPVLVLEQSESKDKQYFKFFLDKSAKNILKIQNLSTGRFYLPVPFEGGTISF